MGTNLNVQLSVSGAVVFGPGTTNSGAITGTAIFTGDSSNTAAGIVNGTAVFSGLSKNNGTVEGDARFLDAAENLGTVTGNATFVGHAKNVQTVLGSATFSGSSKNESAGQVFSNTTFNDNTQNMGQINGNAIFNGLSVNGDLEGGEGGVVTGDATLNDCAQNNGTVAGNITFGGDQNSCEWNVPPTVTASWSAIVGQGNVAILNWKPVANLGTVQSYFTERSKDGGEWVGLEFWSPIIAHFAPGRHTVPAGTDGPGTYVFRITVVRFGGSGQPSEPSNPLTLT